MRLLKHGLVGLFALFTLTASAHPALADGGDDAFGVGASLGVMVEHPVIIPRAYVGYEIQDWIGVILEGRFAPRDPGYLWSAATGVFVRGTKQHLYGKATLTGGVFSTMGREAPKQVPRDGIFFLPRPSQPDMLTIYGELVANAGYSSTDGSFFIGPAFGVGLQPTGGAFIGKNYDLLTISVEIVSLSWRLN